MSAQPESRDIEIQIDDTDTVAVTWTPITKQVAYLNWFAVDDEAQGRGVGTAAYRAWERSLPRSVRTITLHSAATGFWESLGFRETGDADDEGAVAMQKPRRLFPKSTR